MPLPHDYVERVYAGVLGKMIGVYLGRPFEQWSHEQIMARLGEVSYYVHDRRDVALRNHQLVVTDDDLSGTFTFLRALPDSGAGRAITPAQVAEAWLNYIVEGRAVLWWGGFGVSTEHTAYLRLRRGVAAPASGSAALNGPIVAEQIGAQIFIDGWAMVAPGDPDLAADLARRAASVSHDGEAVYAAQALAAMEALAFVEPEIGRLLDAAVARVPPDSMVARLVAELRELRAREPDWRAGLALIAGRYGYDRYLGGCHVVPNHAVVLLGLLWGDGDLGRSLAIAATAGYDTDCNAGNLGCLLGIRGGLAALDAGPHDWRGPVADRIFLATADGARGVSDAVAEAYHVANAGRALQGLPPLAPKGGAQLHFSLPGSVQGFRAEGAALANLAGADGARRLAVNFQLPAGGAARAATPLFIQPDELTMPGYALLASPRLYPGQAVRAAVACAGAPAEVRLGARVYGAGDALEALEGPAVALAPGESAELRWVVPDTGGAPLADLGLTIAAAAPGAGTILVDHIAWGGAPAATLARPAAGGTAWRRAWVDAVEQWDAEREEAYWLTQNSGRGMISQGAAEWRDYEVSAVVTPALCAAAGVAARVQGLRRFYALLLLAGGRVGLLRALGGDTLLAEAPLPWRHHGSYALRLAVAGERLRAWVDGAPLFDLADPGSPLAAGGVALVVEEGHMHCDAVSVAGAPAG